MRRKRGPSPHEPEPTRETDGDVGGLPSDRRTSGWLPILLLGIFAVAMVAPLVFAGRVYLFRDFGLFYHPVRLYFVDRILDGSFPLWAPELNCGTPLHGELVHGFLYPLNLFLFLGPAPGWGLYFATHLLLAGLGTRRLALRFGAAPDAALAAGFAFAGSGYMVSQMNHVPYASAAAWAPLIVSLVMDLPRGRRLSLPLLAGCFAMAALAGEPFTILLTVLFSVVVILGGFAGPRVPAMLKLGTAGAIAILIASPALLPGLQQIGESTRAGGWFSDPDGYGSLHPIRFLTLLAPEAFGRIQYEISLPIPLLGTEVDIYPPILLGFHLGALTVVAVLLAPLRTSRAARWLLPMFVVAGLLSLGPHVGVADWLARNIPGLGSFRYPDKYWFAATLAAAPLLAVALPRLRPGRVASLAIPGAVLAFCAGLATTQLTGALTGAAAFLLVAGAARFRPPWRVKALTAVLALELLFFGIRMGPTTDPLSLSPMHPAGVGARLKQERPGRIFSDFEFPENERIPDYMLMRCQNMEPLAGLPDGFQYAIGYDPIEPLSRLAMYFRMPSEVMTRRNEVWHRLLRLSGTTHSITNKPVRDDEEVAVLRHFRQPAGIQVLRYRRPAARARLYGDAVWVPDRDAARSLVQDLSFDPFRVLVLEGSEPPENAGVPRGGVRFIEDGAHRVVLNVESDRPARLLLADAFAEGWRARVDGHPAEIDCAMVAFRTVRVPRGTSVVEFRYDPAWTRVVPFTAAAGLLFLIFLSIPGRVLRPVFRFRSGSDRRADA